MGIPLFDDETWAQLPSFFDKLPHPVQLTMWGDPAMSYGEQEMAVLGNTLADEFDNIHFRILPRRINYDYYPVIGVMRLEGEEAIDDGVRIIGRPTGYQMTSLITAIQAVSFQGQTLEPLTRIKLQKLNQAINIELLTNADNEAGALMAKLLFGLAVANPHIRTYLVMADIFPEAAQRYSVETYPHTVLNGRIHLPNIIPEEHILKHLAAAIAD